MSAWRRKLIELLPDERKEWEQEDSVYLALGTLLELLEQAVCNDDEARIRNIFAFAEWCHAQRGTDLSNAAGVAFYEHLADVPQVSVATPRYLKRAIFEEIAPLIVAMQGEAAARSIRDGYRR